MRRANTSAANSESEEGNMKGYGLDTLESAVPYSKVRLTLN
jgi:hypothetical protein